MGKDLEKFAIRVGKDDGAIVGGHLAAVRDLEKTLLTVRPDAATCGGTMSMPQDATKPINYPAMLNVSFDLMVAALKCDVTRVAAIQMVDAGGANLPWNFLPEIPEKGGGFHTRLRNWHDLGHNPVLGGTDHKRIADKWCMLQMAKLIERMKAIPEEGGTMLSNSVILWTNHMEDGQNHNCQKLPWILAGQAGGYFKTGQCALSAGKPISGVLADVANAIGVPDGLVGARELRQAVAGVTRLARPATPGIAQQPQAPFSLPSNPPEPCFSSSAKRPGAGVATAMPRARRRFRKPSNPSPKRSGSA